MSSYHKSLLSIAIILTAPCLLFICAGIYKGNWKQIFVWATIFFTWWCVFFIYSKGYKYSLQISLLVINIFWWPLLYRTLIRVIFVFQNHGFERSDGSGSPLAFLIGFTIEQMFFLPLSVALYFGVVMIFNLNKAKQVGTQ